MPETPWVLVAEDDDSDFALILRASQKLQIPVELRRAENGQVAIDMLENLSTKPSLVLLDVKMPKVSGLEVLKAVRQHKSNRFLPVVMLTSSDENADLVKAHEMGCNAYLRKPILYKDFMEALGVTFLFWKTVRLPELL